MEQTENICTCYYCKVEVNKNNSRQIPNILGLIGNEKQRVCVDEFKCFNRYQDYNKKR